MATAAAAAAARPCLMDPQAAAKCSITVSSRQTIHFSHYRSQLCSLSMNGCQGVSHLPFGTVETRSFPAVPTPSLALDRLSSAILNSNPLRLPPELYVSRCQQQVEAIDWLYAQDQFLPRCFFSGRGQTSNSSNLYIDRTNGNDQHKSKNNLVSVASVGSAVFFQDQHPFSYRRWRSLKRFLSTECPLIRAYGAIRFDERANISSEWEAFVYFYFMVPQVEFDELEKGSMLATTIAWDRALSWTLRDAIDALKATLHQISSVVLKLQRHVPWTQMLRKNNIPCKPYWDLAVNRALQKIRSDSALFKVVLARSSRVITATDIDPIAWFCLQPPNAPAFIGNTPEQLFHRKWPGITSEALAGTRARGESMPEDLQIELELLSSVQIEPKKEIRKFPRVQLLYAKLAGRLRSEDDEFEILSSLHPSPAVCGFPTEEARVLIAETEVLDRGMYEGPVGWFGGGESEFAVGIRSALVEKGLGAMIYAGTGVVEGSNALLEWDELELKISRLSKLLKLEVPLEIKS